MSIIERMKWALGSADDVSIGDMTDALHKAGMSVAQPTEEKPRAMFHDPYSVMDWGGWRQRPSALTYETMRHMSEAVSPISAILQLRQDQLAAFARPQQGRYDRGFRIGFRDRRDKKKGMSRGAQKEAERIERMLETTGILLPGEKPSDRDSFRAFVKKAAADVLMYDQWVWEKIRDRKGRISRFIALPSETIRPVVSDIEHLSPAELRSRVSHVQVYENTMISEFTPDDIAWCVKNPRSDIRVNGFGHSPVERIVRLVTAWLFGFEYNTKFFTQGSAVKGLLNIKGTIPDRQMRAFRRMWYTMVSGVNNSWKTPIMNSDEVQWISMHSSNRDMEFGAWQDWLTKLICAQYGVDPVEINFIFGASGSGGSLFDQRPNQAEVIESKDKGLRPLLDHVADHINAHLIWELNPDFEFGFSGFDAKAEDAERKARGEEVKSYLTVNEVRALQNEEPLPDNLGDIILDSTFFQWAQAQQQGGEEGGEGEGGGDDDPFGFGGFGGGNDAADSEDGEEKPDDASDETASDETVNSQSGGEPQVQKSLGAPARREDDVVLSKSLDRVERLVRRLEHLNVWLP